MKIDTVKEIVRWLKDFRHEQITITFHGGEPLLAGADFFREAFPLLAEGLSHLRPAFAIQTNLWLMTPEIAKILAEYHVPVGSSLDGPREINDAQRGMGYFERTMRGYEIAREHGLKVNFICTFTARSYARRDEIVRFFKDRGWSMKIHPALPSLRSHDPARLALAPEDYGDLLVFLLDTYQENPDSMEIMNINDLVKGVMVRHGTVCTFVDCMDSTYAIGPDGRIYPCYRFVGMNSYAMGNVTDRPSSETLSGSTAGRCLERFREIVTVECGNCRHIRYCRGGCPYNAIAFDEGEIHGIDPYCVAYRRIFDEIVDRIDAEMFGSSCILAPGGGDRKGRRSSIMHLIRKIAMSR